MSVCDWCRTAVPGWDGHPGGDGHPAGEGRDAVRTAHYERCPEYLAWEMHPDQGVLREYWIRLGDGEKLRLTRVLGKPVRCTPGMAGYPDWQKWTWPRYVAAADGDVVIVVINKARLGHAGYAWDVAGELGRWVFNDLEEGRANLRATAGWFHRVAEGIEARAAGNPVVRKYPKDVEAKALRPPPADTGEAA